ncbi:beta family protein [Streptomyces johnsoniae]|uniref:beta family protein n=1 Tax=Streptomyces johnsoniae TaxID=3075532 RepID=UPI00374E14B2
MAGLRGPSDASGNDDLFTIARELLRSEHWPASGEATSWGDAELAKCARGERPKAGSGAEWRAWATSHHLAVTAEALRTMGQP